MNAWRVRDIRAVRLAPQRLRHKAAIGMKRLKRGGGRTPGVYAHAPPLPLA